MMSRKLLTAVANLALICAWLPMAHAQSGTKYVVLDNVAGVTGQPQVGDKAAIPMQPNSSPQIDAAGNFIVTCNLAAGKCPNVGTGDASVNLPAAPNVTVSGPSAVVIAAGSNLTWSVPTARTCYGVSATKVSPPTSGPTVTGWVQAWPATGGSYSLNTLFNALPADGIEYTYEFKLGCYSTASTVVNQTTVVAYTEAVRQVKLQKATGGGGGGGGSDYCSEYYPTGHPARSQPGFGGAGLVRVDRQFQQIFSSDGNGTNPKTAQQVVDTAGMTVFGPVPGPAAGPGEYLAIAFTVSENTPNLLGMELSFVEPQGYQGIESTTKWELSVSPCPGDFRAPPAFGADSTTDFYDRRACHKPNGVINFTTGTGTAPASSNACFVKPGATMYLNMTAHDLSAYRANGAAPVWGCNTGVMACGKKGSIARASGY